MIAAHNLSKFYGQLQVLKEVSLEIGSGEIVSITGPSGAGKTTLLQILGTLDKPDSGHVVIDGTNISELSEREMAKYRNARIGFIFQFHQLLPEFTALENICLPAWIGKRSKSVTVKYAKELLEILGMTHRESHKPRELSGGEAQRVAVARALINRPAVVFADEPSGNLDTANANELHRLFFTLRDHFNQTFVIVTHNEELAGSSDRVIRMRDGMLAETTEVRGVE